MTIAINKTHTIQVKLPKLIPIISNASNLKIPNAILIKNVFGVYLNLNSSLSKKGLELKVLYFFNISYLNLFINIQIFSLK